MQGRHLGPDNEKSLKGKYFVDARTSDHII